MADIYTPAAVARTTALQRFDDNVKRKTIQKQYSHIDSNCL